MVWVAGNCSRPKQLCRSGVHACLPTGTLLSPPQMGAQKTQHEQLVKERAALGNLLLREEKFALQLRTHLADLPAGELFKPFQTQRENLGHTVDCKPLGGGNHLVTP